MWGGDMRPSYTPHPHHFYEDKTGLIHLCDGADATPKDFLVWTLCEKMDVPADKSFMSTETVATCIDCRKKAGLQL
jgi:hypothetical protein